MDFSNPMNIWWLVMIALNVLSVIVYIVLFRKSVLGDEREPENRRYKTILRTAGAIFVFVSMYRSVFVSSYPNRLVWVDTMFNSPLLIRFLATFAEISFAILVSFPIIHLNREMPADCAFTRNKIGYFLVNKLPYLTLICLCTAQIFAYTGLFTQYLVLFAIEETLWALGFLAVAPAAITQCRNVFRNHRGDRRYRLIKGALVMLSVYTVGYLVYQFGFALPFTYYARIADDMARTHLGLAQGAHDALFLFTATQDFDVWGGIGFFIWHSGYFSICTWMNILFAMAPRVLKK